MSRSLFQIEADLKRLREERRTVKRKTFAPGHVRSRSFRPEGPGQRQPRERDNRHLAFIRRLPCAACGIAGPCDAAQASDQHANQLGFVCPAALFRF